MRIQVTQADIDKGMHETVEFNAISQAIHRTIKGDDLTHVEAFGKWADVNGVLFYLPKEARDFLEKNEADLTPFEFELTEYK